MIRSLVTSLARTMLLPVAAWWAPDAPTITIVGSVNFSMAWGFASPTCTERPQDTDLSDSLNRSRAEKILTVAHRRDGLLAQIETDVVDDRVLLSSLLQKCIVLGGQAGSEKMRDWAVRSCTDMPRRTSCRTTATFPRP